MDLGLSGDQGIDLGASDLGLPDLGPPDPVVVPMGDLWEYHDQPAVPPDGWRDGVGSWPSGRGEFGYGDGDEVTLLLDVDPNVPSVYFRRNVELTFTPSRAVVDVVYDDGFTLWVGDTIVAQENVADTDHDSLALTRVMGDNAMTTIELDPSAFAEGTNAISVQLKQFTLVSTDLSFDLRLEVHP